MTQSFTESTFSFDDPKLSNILFGAKNQNLETLAQLSELHIGSRGTALTLKGPEAKVKLAEKVLGQLYRVIKDGGVLGTDDVVTAYRMLTKDPETDLKRLFEKTNFVVSPRMMVTPKSHNQRVYMDALSRSAMTIAAGPAGTGKTYLAVAMALSELYKKKVKRLVLTRPAVEAGEKLGFLPGDMAQKVNPYLRPLFDSLHDMLDFDRVQEMMDSGVIEIAPLAFMRGRTLNDAFIILDEAQNTTIEQMKMFVTRLGFGSRMAITGDITQIDLPRGGGSGLVDALKVLKNIEDIEIVHFEEKDVIRHPLVGRIVKAYDSFQEYSR